jgi:nitrite reductase/ring-hydroxylating ferredoxin subunit
MGKHIVGTVAEIPPGSRRLVSVKGRPIAIFNLDGAFFGLLNTCPHQGASLSKGVVGGLVEADGPDKIRCSRRGEIVACPWHGWEFDIRTGQSWCDPAKVSVKSYPVKVEQGDALVKGPYVAETFPVSVEEDYVVVEL